MNKRELYEKHRAEQAKEDGVICVCKQVTERKIRKAVRNGRTRYVSIKQATEAGSSCGFCQPFVEDIIEDEKQKR